MSRRSSNSRDDLVRVLYVYVLLQEMKRLSAETSLAGRGCEFGKVLLTRMYAV